MAALSSPFAITGDTSSVHTSATTVVGTPAWDAAGNEYIYMPGASSMAAGDFVTYDEAFAVTRLVNTASAGAPVAMAMAAIAATTSYGWYLVKGSAAVANGASDVTDNCNLFVSATAGRAAADNSLGKRISRAVARSAASSNVFTVQLDRSFVDIDVVSQLRVATFSLNGDAIHAAVLPIFTAPAACIIERVVLNITTKSTGASTLDVGYTAVSSTTSADNFIDGIDSGTAIGFWDSNLASLDSGANTGAQLAAAGKWVTVDDKTGDSSGLLGTAYIYYRLLA